LFCQEKLPKKTSSEFVILEENAALLWPENGLLAASDVLSVSENVARSV
jgi:hypothetical protein